MDPVKWVSFTVFQVKFVNEKPISRLDVSRKRVGSYADFSALVAKQVEEVVLAGAASLDLDEIDGEKTGRNKPRFSRSRQS